MQRIDHISSIKGRLSTEDVVEYSGGESNATYFMCGPQGFMETIESALVSSGVSAEKINKEYFQAKQKNEYENEYESIIFSYLSSRVTLEICFFKIKFLTVWHFHRKI